jgi:carbonic anhydrase
MVSRRALVGGAAAAAAILAGPASAQDTCTVFTRHLQQSTSPEAALQLLKEGNARFLAGKPARCDLLAQVQATAAGQAPFAAVLGCIDSRVPPELIFDRHLGDLFVARVAGNFVNDDLVGSLEFAARIAGARAIVVLGHSECGAIKGAIDQVKLGRLTKLLEHFEPAIVATTGSGGERSSKNSRLVQAVAETHARLAARALTDRSETLREMRARNELVVAAAMHDIATGRVMFLP